MGSEKSSFSGVLPTDFGPVRLDRLVADAVAELSRERVKALIGQGHLTVDGKIILDPSEKKWAGHSFTLSVPLPVEGPAKPQDIPLDVVFEDAHLIIVNKPAGLVVHPAAGHPDGTLVNALLHHCAGQLSGIGGVTRPGIVHRIDKDTSGLMVAAKTDAAHEGLSRLFAAHDIERRYLAIVHGLPIPAKATITGNIGRSSTDRKKMALVEDGHGKHAITHYEVLERLRGASLVSCTLETGRTHQVRVHMTSLGHSLIGDPLYQSRRKKSASGRGQLAFDRQALHAESLGFVHPVTGEKMRFSCNLPDDMQELFSMLKL
jgi:23S rRNA pseudouridine1911/1915/1917 synthase